MKKKILFLIICASLLNNTFGNSSYRVSQVSTIIMELIQNLKPGNNTTLGMALSRFAYKNGMNNTEKSLIILERLSAEDNIAEKLLNHAQNNTQEDFDHFISRTYLNLYTIDLVRKVIDKYSENEWIMEVILAQCKNSEEKIFILEHLIAKGITGKRLNQTLFTIFPREHQKN
jgi:hypothetical protein